MSIDQINEYMRFWSDKNSTEVRNPDSSELEMFNMLSGISRKQVPKK